MTDEEATSEGLTAEDAFGLLGNELRAEIMRVLGESPHEGLSFSELRTRVDEGVDSGQFNYHLQKLVGPFVENTDDGYVLRAPGLALYRAIRSGAFNRRVTVEPFDAGFDCYFCSTPVEASYDDGSFRLVCPGCDHLFASTMLPPSAVSEADETELLARVDQYNRHQMLVASRGVCPICVNPMELEFVPSEEVWSEGSERLDVFVHWGCDHCGRQQYMTVGLALLYHPALTSSFYEHGVDLTSVNHWELEFVLSDEHTTVRSRDPWEVAVAVTLEGLTLELVVDEELNVIETNRY
jgi:DNA-binding transcriptional ArsR family regulator